MVYLKLEIDVVWGAVGMGDEELFYEMKNGNPEAFKKYFYQYSSTIARSAFQYGQTVNDANETSLRTFRLLFTEIDEIINEQQFFQRMYEIAIQQLTTGEQSDLNEFLFEEDYLLHQKIIQLKHEDKLVLILSLFQKLEHDLIIELLQMDREVFSRKIIELQEQLDERYIERRLTLLKNSYDRMTFQVQEQFDRLEEIPEETYEEMYEETHTKSRRGIIAILSGFSILVVLIIISIVNSDSFKRASTEKWIEGMKASYEEKLAATYEELGLSVETVAEADFFRMNEMTYLGYEAKNKYDRFIKVVERDFEGGEALIKDEISDEFNKIIENLKTPKEMMADLYKQPLTDDFEGSERFLEQYIAKQYTLGSVYLADIYIDPVMAEELFGFEESVELGQLKERINELPEDIQKNLQKMEEQHIYIDLLFNESSDEREKYITELRKHLHPDVGGYTTIIGASPYSYYVAPNQEMDDILIYLADVENTLLATSMNRDIQQILNEHYVWTLVSLLNGMDEGIYGDDGKVKKEIRQTWRDVVSGNEDTVFAFIIEKVMEEFEATNWKTSEMQVFLSHDEINDLIVYAKENNLQTYEWAANRRIHHMDIALPNVGFQYILESTYEQFKKNYDDMYLKNSHPITVLGLFFYANELEDAETLWHLYHEESKPDTLEKYMADWAKKAIVYSEIEHLGFDSYGNMGSFSSDEKYGFLQMRLDKNGLFVESINFE